MRWLIILLCLTFVACTAAIKETRERGAENVVVGDIAPGLLTPINAPVIGMFRGEPFTLRYNVRGELVYKRNNEEQVISKDSPPKSNLTHIVAHADEKGIYVFWRPKLTATVEGVGIGGDKFVYFKASYDGKTFGKTQRLNEKGGAFLPRVAGNGSGDLYVVWMDERNGGGKYDLYMNISHDSGRTWKEKDFRIDIGEPGSSASLDPTIVAEGSEVWVAWNEAIGREDQNLYVRFSGDCGERWEEAVLIAKEKESPTGLTLIKKGNALILYWFNWQELKLAYSENRGLSWKVQKPEGLENVAEIKVLKTDDKVYLIAGILPEGKKEDLFVATSDDGIHFRKPVRLDTSTPHFTTSTGPGAAGDGMGNILVAWHDLRNFRSNIYFNYSVDKGQTWLKQDLRIDAEGVRHFYYPRVAADGKGGFYILWVGYEDERLEKSKVYLSRVNAKEGFVNPATLKQSDVKRLRERVTKFWDDRKAAHWAGNYDLLDPFVRDKYSKEYYVSSQFKTIYHDYEIKEVKITENIASVTIKYAVEVPEFISPSGKKLSVPRKDEEITEEWIWVDGDWFRTFKDIMGQSFIMY